MKSRGLMSILDEIDQYKSIISRHGYCMNTTPGKAPWSHNHAHSNKTSIDINGNGWIMYDADGMMTRSGRTPAELSSLFADTK